MEDTGLITTVVGSMPKPDYVKIPCWVSNGKEDLEFVNAYNDVQQQYTVQQLNDQIIKGTQQVINMQTEIGKKSSTGESPDKSS